MSIERRPSRFEQKIILTPLRKFIEHTYNIEVISNDTIGLKPPYLLISNHVTNWDPFFINCYVDEPICFVAAASNYQKSFMQNVLNYAGAISKTKSQADSSTIRNIHKAIKNKRAVAIFPEGNRTWNGQTDAIFYSTAKLIRSLKIPVVVVNIKGGYLSHPRWAESVRKGKVMIELRKLWDKSDLVNQTAEQLYDHLTKELFVNDIEWQKETGIEFDGKNLAHYLERYLFACPQCRDIGTMNSDNDIYSCKHCRYKVRYTKTGTFEQVEQPVYFEQVYDWNKWQVRLLEEQIDRISEINGSQYALNQRANLSKMTVNGEYRLLGKYQLHFEDTTINFIPLTKKETPFQINIEQIIGENIFKQKIINFIYAGEQYHLDLIDPRASAYLLTQYIHLVKNNIINNKV